MSTIKCISPIDGSVYAEREVHSVSEAEKKIALAKKSQREWASTPLENRIALVKQGIDRLGDMNDKVVEGLAHMMGRPVRYGGEFSGVKERTEFLCGVASESLADKVVENSEKFIRKITREPHKIVFVIAPWNYPYLTAVNTIVPALLAGNAVILKHSTQTLLVGEHFQAAFDQAGLPEGVFQNVFFNHETTETLIAQKNFGFINFTGSVAGGRSIETAAAGTFTNMTLELGGKDPGYVMEDADLIRAVETLIDGAMYNSGQCCCGIERIYVVEKCFNEFVERAVDLTSRYILGNPLDKEVTLGPMANLRFANEVRAQVKEAILMGAKTCIDPKLFPLDKGDTPYLMPQILTEVNHNMDVMKEETFGPVVGIMKVKNDEEAISLMNDSPYGLTASLWTKDPVRAEHIGKKIETGTVFMNRADYLDPALCWTGCKNTGKGASLSEHAFSYLTRPKSYHLKKV